VTVDGPLVSVITVVKNGERYLADAIGSIIAQTYQPYEIIVVDGQSTDDTAKIAGSFPRVRYILQNNRGLASARNIGIAEARGELIAFLDHDDLWVRNKLNAQVKRLVNNPELGYTITWMEYVREPGCAPRLDGKPSSAEQPHIGCTPSALIARKSLFALVGPFNPAFTIGCDVDWFTRARDISIPTEVIPQVLLYKRIHNVNLSSDIQVNRRELFAIARQSIQRRRGAQRMKSGE
jgi:glycosyltransferase involved in cell wall biosynthesis